MFYTKRGLAMPVSICIDLLNKPNTKYSQSRLSETWDHMWDTYSQNLCKFHVKFDIYDLVLLEHIRGTKEIKGTYGIVTSSSYVCI